MFVWGFSWLGFFEGEAFSFIYSFDLIMIFFSLFHVKLRFLLRFLSVYNLISIIFHKYRILPWRFELKTLIFLHSIISARFSKWLIWINRLLLIKIRIISPHINLLIWLIKIIPLEIWRLIKYFIFIIHLLNIPLRSKRWKLHLVASQSSRPRLYLFRHIKFTNQSCAHLVRLILAPLILLFLHFIKLLPKTLLLHPLPREPTILISLLFLLLNLTLFIMYLRFRIWIMLIHL